MTKNEGGSARVLDDFASDALAALSRLLRPWATAFVALLMTVVLMLTLITAMLALVVYRQEVRAT
jgi:hypothetical protein